MEKMELIRGTRKINKMARLRKNIINNLHYLLLCDIFFIRYFIRSMNEYGA